MKKRLPEWLKKGIINTDTTKKVRNILKTHNLNTVCDKARCPNKNECYSSNTATFLIMGNICTRNCKFCSIEKNKPEDLNNKEPFEIASAVKKLGLTYVVITSVTRDDLPDGGADHFARTINSLRSLNKDIKIEVLTPDFNGNINSIHDVIRACPDVFNHNIETVKELYQTVRPQAKYDRSLELLKLIKETNPAIYTKSGLMVGFGETTEQIKETLFDLNKNNCDIVTIGQYIQPTKEHIEVEKYYTPEEFDNLSQIAQKIGIKHVTAAPLVRSSYKAKTILRKLTEIKNS